MINMKDMMVAFTGYAVTSHAFTVQPPDVSSHAQKMLSIIPEFGSVVN